MLGRGGYYLEYPEDIRLYGASFSTTLPTGTAWTGEISYRPNAPVQLSTNDLTLALVNPITGGAASPIATAPGADNTGYRRKEVTQVQSTLTHFFDQVLGRPRLVVVLDEIADQRALVEQVRERPQPHGGEGGQRRRPGWL